MSDTTHPAAPAGWYDDGTATDTQRYWDGAQWTEHTRSAIAPPPPSTDASVPNTTPAETEPSTPSAGGKAHVLSWIALGVAAVGFIFACIPGALIVGWVLLPIAFILSIVALFLKGTKWPAITALITAVVGTIVGVVVFTSFVVASVDSVIKDTEVTTSSDSAAEEEDATAPSLAPEPEPEPELGNLAFGEAATFENGVSISVSAPVPFTPTEYAAGNDFPNNLLFTLTITNGSDENLDAYAYSSVTSGGQVGSSVFDTTNDTSSPSGVILPGQSISWTEAWSVADANAIVFEVSPGFDYEDVIFTNVQ